MIHLIFLEGNGRAKGHSILLFTDGSRHNVLKLKPPIVFTEINVSLLIQMLDKVLAEDSICNWQS